MLIKCLRCGKPFQRRPSKLKDHNYCSRKCTYDGSSATAACSVCGKFVTRHKSWIRKTVLCSPACTATWKSKHMASMNLELNPDRMTPNTRLKLREARLGTGEGKSYEKTFSRPTHRIVAESILGRKFKKGEVVHHIDENKRNNDPLNLMVFSSQAEHAAWHQKLLRDAK